MVLLDIFLISDVITNNKIVIFFIIIQKSMKVIFGLHIESMTCTVFILRHGKVSCNVKQTLPCIDPVSVTHRRWVWAVSQGVGITFLLVEVLWFEWTKGKERGFLLMRHSTQHWQETITTADKHVAICCWVQTRNSTQSAIGNVERNQISLPKKDNQGK